MKKNPKPVSAKKVVPATKTTKKISAKKSKSPSKSTVSKKKFSTSTGSFRDKVKKTLILIPTYNEKDNIREIIQALRSLYPDIMVLVIDDSSPDGTADLVKKIIRKDKKIFLIDKGEKLGIGKAYIRGFNKALELSKTLSIDYIVQMDADFSHDPVYITYLLEKINDHDLVIGSRYAQGVNVVNWPMSRVLLSYFANQYVNLITRVHIHDVTGGFKVFRRTALEHINFDRVVSNGYVFQIEMNYILKKLGFKVAEVPIIFRDRQRGASKINFQIIREAMIRVLFFPFHNLNNYKKNK